MKKIILILMMFLLCACGSNAVDLNELNNDDTDSTTTSLDFIEPVGTESVFKYLNDDTKSLLYKANDNKSLDNSTLQNLGKELIGVQIVSYDGQTINLSDYKDSKLVIEVVASWCSHCKDQALNYNDELLNALGEDATLIQYFANGDSSNVESFYKEVGVDIPSDIIVGLNDNDVSNKLVDAYGLEMTPTFYFFNNGILTWTTTGTVSASKYELFKDVAFDNALDLNKLTDSDGVSILDYIRDEDDVKNDLSQENYNKLVSLDNDDYTIEFTLKYLGSDAGLLDQLSDDSNFNAEANLEDYIDKEVIVIFIYEYNTNQINMINEFTSKNGDVNVVVVNNSDEDNETIAKALDAPLVSIMNQVPSLFDDINFANYPTALFIKEGTITGAYSNIESSDKLLEAYNIFLTDNSIALKANN